MEGEKVRGEVPAKECPAPIYESDIKYHVTLDGCEYSLVPWPRIESQDYKPDYRESGRVLQPEHAAKLKEIFEKKKGEKHPNKGYTTHLKFYGILKNTSLTTEIDAMFDAARSYVSLSRVGEDGFAYIDDQLRTKIDTSKATDPSVGAGARSAEGPKGAGLGGRRRSSRKYKKSKRVYRKKSRATKRH